MKKVLVAAFDGCEDIELFAVVDILKRCQIQVEIWNPNSSEFVTTKSKIKFFTDIQKFNFENLKTENAAIYFPGGSIVDSFDKFTSSDEFAEFKSAVNLFAKNGGIVSANCIAPALLESVDFFSFQPNRKIVCYPKTEIGHVENEFLASQSNFAATSQNVHVSKEDGTVIVTGNGPSASFELGFAIAQLLVGKSIVNEVKEDMLLEGDRFEDGELVFI